MMKEYEITLTSGVWYLLAPNSEAAAWAALSLAKDAGEQLINVRLAEQWWIGLSVLVTLTTN